MKFPIALCLLALCAALPAEAASPVAKIVVSTAIGSLGTADFTDFVVIADKDAYRAEWKLHSVDVYQHTGSDGGTGNGRVDKAAVDAFVAALRAQELRKPTLENIGIDRDWLIRNKDKAGYTFDDPFGRQTFAHAASNLKALYDRTLTDPVLAQKALERHFGSIVSDLGVKIEVTVTFADGSIMSAESFSQHEFGLPWTIAESGRKTWTFNADIGRTLAALLPENAAARSLLLGSEIEETIPRILALSIADDWETLDARNRTGAAIAVIENKLRLVKARVSHFYDWRFGDDDKGESLKAEFHDPKMPPNVSFAVRLAMQNGQAVGAGAFLESVPLYERLFGSVRWMHAFALAHPKLDFRISYIEDGSVGTQLFEAFAKDMQALKKDRLVREVDKVRGHAMLVLTGWDYKPDFWIVLPDRRTILWRQGGTYQQDYLKIPSGEIGDGNWCKPDEYDFRCIGDEISPAGKLLGAGGR